MKIKRRSPLTGLVNEMDLPVTDAQILSWQGGELIQRVMPDLTVEQREFLISGCYADDWTLLPPEED